jgi:hypothetical protein
VAVAMTAARRRQMAATPSGNDSIRFCCVVLGMAAPLNPSQIGND